MGRSKKPKAQPQRQPHNNIQNIQDSILKIYEYLLRVEPTILHHIKNNDTDSSVTSLDKAIAHYNEEALRIQDQIKATGFNSDQFRHTFSLVQQIVQRFYELRNKMKPDKSTEDDLDWALSEIKDRTKQLSEESQREAQRRRAEERRVTKEVLFSSFFNQKPDSHSSTSPSNGTQHKPK